MHLLRISVFALAVWGLTASFAPAQAAISDKLLPDETEVVVGINVRVLLDSEVIKKNALDDIKRQIKNSPANEILGQMGLDPLKDIDSVMIAIGSIKIDAAAGARPQTTSATLMFLKGKFEQEKIAKALGELREKMPEAVQIHEHAKVTIYQTKRSDQEQFTAFLEKGHVIAGTKKEYVVEAIDKFQGTKKTKLKNKDVAAAITRADEKQTIWMAMAMPDGVKDFMKNAPEGAELADKLEAMTLAVTMKEGILVQFDMHCVDKDATGPVKELVEKAKAGIALYALTNKEVGPTMDEVMKNTRISNKEKVVTIRMEMDKDLAEKVFKLMQSFQP